MMVVNTTGTARHKVADNRPHTYYTAATFAFDLLQPAASVSDDTVRGHHNEED